MFQAPSLDRKLTVAENIRLQGSLYGLSAAESWLSRLDELLDHFALRDRANELVEALSGGLRRRVELAKGMMHQPPLLLLDEPTTGLDPRPRSDLWQYLTRLREQQGTTIVFTTHYLGRSRRGRSTGHLERRQARRSGKPGELRQHVGGDSITIETERAADAGGRNPERLGCNCQQLVEARPTGSTRWPQLDSPARGGVSRAEFARFAWASQRWKMCSSPERDIAFGRTGSEEPTP